MYRSGRFCHEPILGNIAHKMWQTAMSYGVGVIDRGILSYGEILVRLYVMRFQPRVMAPVCGVAKNQAYPEAPWSLQGLLV